ncbi:MAG: hypothetical protein AB1489_30090, partial [Acidobacteriota bacterium]
EVMYEMEFDNSRVFSEFLSKELERRNSGGALPTTIYRPAYPDLPTERLKELKIDYRQVFFNFIIEDTATSESNELTTSSEGKHLPGGDMYHYFLVNIYDNQKSIKGLFKYVVERFDAKTIEYLVELYKLLLERAVRNPYMLLSELYSELLASVEAGKAFKGKDGTL